MVTPVATIPPAFVDFLGLGSDPGTGGEGVAPVSTRVQVLSVFIAINVYIVSKPTEVPTAVCPDAANYFGRLGDGIAGPTRVDVATESSVERNV